MSSSETFYWHDYETFGVDPAWDRPVQFAGVRTDLDFNPVGEPLLLYARPPRDYLPSPGACLVTGITPQEAELKGLPEAEFIARINAEFAAPGTCALGYNSLRFDDTVTRFSLYRNLRDPYAREYGEGRSRWDLIDVVRTAYALRPEGIEWPLRDDGLPSFRLEDLALANGLEHGQAHDALADVRATIALARLINARQPRLFQWLYRQRGRQAVQGMIDVTGLEPLLHVSGMFGAARANLGLIVPLAWHPANRNEIICYDLSIDPTPLFEIDSERLRTLLFTRRDDLAEGEQRPGIKSVHANRCPVLLPPQMADATVARRSQLDLDACRRHLRLLRDHEERFPGALRDKVRQVSHREASNDDSDPDLALYSGGFLPREDRQTLDRLLALAPEELAGHPAAFHDTRLEEMLFRYRARNYPETLDATERERWEDERFARITQPPGPARGIEAFQEELSNRLEQADIRERDRQILEALQAWGDELLA